MRRIPALDGLRGCLALLVVAVHIGLAFGSRALIIPGFVAVLGFFAMSGFVLARAYDGHPVAFMARRLVRLWPLYATCIVTGYAMLGRTVPALELVWWPLPAWGSAPAADPPAWSLYYEAWATLAFPALFWIAALDRRAIACLAVGVACCCWLDFRWFLAAFFVAGVAAARFDIRFAWRMPGAALWLGRVSFSLYLTHQLVLNAGERAFGPLGAIYALPFVLPVAWAVWWAIERPSIILSRQFGMAVMRLQHAQQRRQGEQSA